MSHRSRSIKIVGALGQFGGDIVDQSGLGIITGYIVLVQNIAVLVAERVNALDVGITIRVIYLDGNDNCCFMGEFAHIVSS